jgi:hypothetical protein
VSIFLVQPKSSVNDPTYSVTSAGLSDLVKKI